MFRTNNFRALAFALVAFGIFPTGKAGAQQTNPGVQQAGTVTAGHCAAWGPGVGQIQDAGACNALGAVQSVFGRTGAVVAQSGDYSFALVAGFLAATQMPALTGGDVTSSQGSGVLTLNTVNSNVGSFGGPASIPSFTVDAKGRITAASANTPVIPAADVTGTFGIAQGGTGQTTRAPALAALMPVPTRAGDIAYWNGTAWVTLAGNNSGTQTFVENASGLPAWSAVGTGTVTEQKNTAGAGLTTSGTCDNTSTNASTPCQYALALNSATLDFSTANPTGTASTTGVMMGLGTSCTITPVYSGRVHVTFDADMSTGSSNSTTTHAQIKFGTGTPPSNGASPVGSNVSSQADAWISATSSQFAFSRSANLTGLTPGVAIWIDADFWGNAGTNSLTNIHCSAMEY